MLQLPRDYAPLSTHPALVGTQTRAFRAKTAITTGLLQRNSGIRCVQLVLERGELFLWSETQTDGRGGRAE